MAHFMQPDEQANRLTTVPSTLPILPLRNTIAYPFSVMPLSIGLTRSVQLIEDAMRTERLLGLVAVPDSTVELPGPGQVYDTGTLASIQNAARTPDGNLQVVVQGIERFRIAEWVESPTYLRARIALAPDIVTADTELTALAQSLRQLAQDVAALSPLVPRVLRDFLTQVRDPRFLVYLVAASARLEVAEGQRLLETDDLKEKLRLLIAHLTREKEILGLRQKIQSEAKEEMDKAQREYFLRQQLKAIHKELGESGESQALSEEYRQKIEAAVMPEEAKQEALRELQRLEGMSPQAAEHSVIKTYLDWLVALPWNVRSTDAFNMAQARAVLDVDHYVLEEVKDRMLDHIAGLSGDVPFGIHADEVRCAPSQWA